MQYPLSGQNRSNTIRPNKKMNLSAKICTFVSVYRQNACLGIQTLNSVVRNFGLLNGDSEKSSRS